MDRRAKLLAGINVAHSTGVERTDVAKTWNSEGMAKSGYKFRLPWPEELLEPIRYTSPIPPIRWQIAIRIARWPCDKFGR